MTSAMRKNRSRGFSIKEVADKSVLYVMAADAEYGPHLQAAHRAADDRRRTGRGRRRAGRRTGAARSCRTRCRRWSCRSARPAAARSSRPASTRRRRFLPRHGRLAARLREGRDAIPRPAGGRAAAAARSGHSRGDAVDRRRHHLRRRPTRRSPPTWSTWRPLPCCAPANSSACR